MHFVRQRGQRGSQDLKLIRNEQEMGLTPLLRPSPSFPFTSTEWSLALTDRVDGVSSARARSEPFPERAFSG